MAHLPTTHDREAEWGVSSGSILREGGREGGKGEREGNGRMEWERGMGGRTLC